MIVCRGCGHGNEEATSFCASCGAFLEWDGERMNARSAQRRTGSTAVTAVASLPRQQDRLDPTSTTDDSDLEAEVEAVDIPDGRLPEAEQPRTPPVRPQAYDVGPADQYCGACGAGNARERRYCRACGEPLADIEHEAELSWWARLVAWVKRLFRRDKSLSAGERPENWGKASATTSSRTGRNWRRIRVPNRISLKGMRIPLIILGVAGLTIAPVRMQITQWGFEAYNSVRRVVYPDYVRVVAATAAASSISGDDHSALLAIDDNSASWWAEGAPGNGEGESLTVTFERAADIAKLVIVNGADTNYTDQPRVRQVEVTFNDDNGLVATKRIDVADKPKKDQQFDMAGQGVTSVTLRILSTYAGQVGDAASLAEVAFHAKK